MRPASGSCGTASRRAGTSREPAAQGPRLGGMEVRPHVRFRRLLRRVLAVLPLAGGPLCALIFTLGASCTPSVAPVQGVISALPDSIRYVTPDRNQPYALLWPSNNTLNLWLSISATRTCRVGTTDTYHRREYSAVFSASSQGGRWIGSVTSSTDSTVSGDLSLLAVTPDSMSGLAVMHATDTCGECPPDSVTLSLVRVP